MNSTASELLKWMTDEMSVIPCKYVASSRVPITAQDIAPLTEGHGEGLWKHIIKHVYSVKKVEHVRKTIMLNRLKTQRNSPEIQKDDHVGNLLNTIRELRSVNSTIEEYDKKNKAAEARIDRLTDELKVKACMEHYQLKIAEESEKRLEVLKMARNVARAKKEMCTSSEEMFRMEFPLSDLPSPHTLPLMSSSILTDSMVSSSSGYSGSRDDSLFPAFSTNNCQLFLERCFHIARELLNDRDHRQISDLNPKNLTVGSENSTFSNISTLSFMEQDFPQFTTPRFDAIKKKLRKEVEQAKKCLPRQLYETFLVMMARVSKLSNLCPQESANETIGMNTRLYDKPADHLEDVKQWLNEEVNRFRYTVLSTYVDAGEAKFQYDKLLEYEKNLMSEVECELRKILSVDEVVQKRVYDLAKNRARLVYLEAVVQYLKKTIYEMENTKDTSTARLAKLKDQVKEIDADNARQEKYFEHWKNTWKQLIEGVQNNHKEFQKNLAELSDLDTTFKEMQFTSGLANKELLTFNDFPLEILSRTELSWRESVPESDLLINSTNWLFLAEGNKDDELSKAFAQWVKATYGKVPYSSVEHIYSTAVEAMIRSKQLNSLRSRGPVCEDEKIQTEIDKVPGFIEDCEDDDQNWITLMENFTSERNDFIEKTVAEQAEADTTFRYWSEGRVQKCIPGKMLVDGKNFQHWYLEYHTSLKNNEFIRKNN